MLGKPNTKWVSVAIILLVTTMTFAGCIGQEEEPEVEKTTWDKIVEAGTIRVATSPDWPPFEYYDPVTGEVAGFEIDVLEEIIHRLNEQEGVSITTEWIPMEWGTIKEAVENKQVDLGVSGFSVTPERWEFVQYCTPHSITEAQVIALKDVADRVGMLENLTQLDDYGLKCGAQSGTTQEEEMLRYIEAGELSEENLIIYQDNFAAMEDLVAGGMDCIFQETPVTYYFMEEYQKKGYELDLIYRAPYWPVAFIANHDSDILVAKISGQVALLIATGWIAEKNKEYGMVY